MSASPYIRRATTSVLIAVALIGGAILFLGDRFDAVPGYALTQPVRVEARVAACVAEESMRLIDSDVERCRPGELELASQHTAQSAVGQVRCPAGKVAVGGGVLPDPDNPRKGDAPQDRTEVVVSGPLLPSGDAGGYGWTATVRNTGTAPLSVIVAAICVILR